MKAMSENKPHQALEDSWEKVEGVGFALPSLHPMPDCILELRARVAALERGQSESRGFSLKPNGLLETILLTGGSDIGLNQARAIGLAVADWLHCTGANTGFFAANHIRAELNQ